MAGAWGLRGPAPRPDRGDRGKEGRGTDPFSMYIEFVAGDRLTDPRAGAIVGV